MHLQLVSEIVAGTLLIDEPTLSSRAEEIQLAIAVNEQ